MREQMVHTNAGAWIGFAIFIIVLALIFPWIWGYIIGVFGMWLLTYFFYKMLGG